jgi:hypothetical protein
MSLVVDPQLEVLHLAVLARYTAALNRFVDALQEDELQDMAPLRADLDHARQALDFVERWTYGSLRPA